MDALSSGATHSHSDSAKPRLLDTLLNENRAAAFLGVSARALQKWRVLGSGPQFVRISARCIRYRPSDLALWAEDRLRQSTSDYERNARPNAHVPARTRPRKFTSR